MFQYSNIEKKIFDSFKEHSFYSKIAHKIPLTSVVFIDPYFKLETMSLIAESRKILRGLTHPNANAIKSNGRAQTDDQLEFTIFLNANASGKELPLAEHYHHLKDKLKSIVNRLGFEKLFGAHDEDIEKVRAFALRYHLQIVEVHKVERWISLKGTVANIEAAFKIEIHEVADSDAIHYFYKGAISVPAELSSAIESVVGISTEPIKSEKVFPVELTLPHAILQGKAVFPADFENLYHFPDDLDGSGQCIGIITLGGGYLKDSLEKYFRMLGKPMPDIRNVRVGKGKNNPGKNFEYDYEVNMDIQIAGALAPGAKIVVYFAENSRLGIAHALKKAVHDRRNKPNIISMSWGAIEKRFTAREIKSINKALREAAALNITVITSSGDLGATGALGERQNNIQMPASSPFVLAVGGTEVEVRDEVIVGEKAWSEKVKMQGKVVVMSSGGGSSTVWRMPDYQKNLVTRSYRARNRRCIPDVAANASTKPGMLIFVGETEQIAHLSLCRKPAPPAP